jgi:CubicO group peptidase (beta-lactamase class C family)
MLSHSVLARAVRIGGVFLLFPALACSRAADLPVRARPAAALVPGATWERLANPGDLGWDSGRLSSARRLSEANSGTSAVAIVWRGLVVDQWGDVDARWTVRSIRKSLLSALLAEPVLDGRLPWTATLSDLGIDDRTPLTAEEKEATVGDLLASRSGVYIPAARENAGHRRRRPPRGSHPHGSFFYYNNWDFNVLGELYRDRVSNDVGGDFARRVAGPIGMQDYRASDFEWRPERISAHPAYDFEMSARDLARYGLLWLRRGLWGDRQVIPAEWIAQSTAAVTLETGMGAGYGRLWWVQPPGRSKAVPEGYFFAEGGSCLWVVPSRDLVVVHHQKSNLGLLRSRLGLLPDEEKVREMFDRIAEAAPKSRLP